MEDRCDTCSKEFKEHEGRPYSTHEEEGWVCHTCDKAWQEGRYVVVDGLARIVPEPPQTAVLSPSKAQQRGF